MGNWALVHIPCTTDLWPVLVISTFIDFLRLMDACPLKPAFGVRALTIVPFVSVVQPVPALSRCECVMSLPDIMLVDT